MNLGKPMLSSSTAPHPTQNRTPTAANANKTGLRPTEITTAPARTLPKLPSLPKRSPSKNKTKTVAKPAIERHYHQTIRRIDLWSVLKVSICFYLCALLVFIGAGVILWFVADTFNVIHKVESFVGDLFDDKGFKFFPTEILRAATLLGLVFTSMATVMTVLATGFYNLFSDLIGGIEITVAEES